jgi:MFS family permease
MGAGTIADIYEPHERGKALAYYTCGPLLGPALGPIIGGYLNQKLGWRSNFYFLAIYALVVCVAIIIFLPETWRSLKPTIQLQQLQQQYIDHNEKSNNNSTTTMKQDAEEVVQTKKDVRYTVLNKKTKTKFINPIGALKLFLYPNISLCIAFIGVV